MHLDLNVLWEKFEDPTILAGLIPSEKTVVLNENKLKDFEENKGWENFTKSHEIGHWILHVDQTDFNSEPLPGFNRPYEIICRGFDNNWDEINADKFASHFLMPKELILKNVKQVNSWSDIYELAEMFGVSTTAMKVRLEKMGLLFIDEKGHFIVLKNNTLGKQQQYDHYNIKFILGIK